MNNCMADHVDAECWLCMLVPLWNFTKSSLTVHVK